MDYLGLGFPVEWWFNGIWEVAAHEAGIAVAELALFHLVHVRNVANVLQC